MSTEELIRQEIANYIYSEGCGCCSDAPAHAAAEKQLAELLSVEIREDGSGYDWFKYKTN